GTSTGPWPSGWRHLANAAPCVWAYNPQHRTSTAPGGGTWSRQRPMNCASGRRTVPCLAWPPWPLPRSSYPKTTCGPSHARRRLLAMGPPRKYRPSAVLTKYLCMPGRGDRLGAMKPPLYIRHITDEERAVLAAGLRSHDAFTVRRCQIVFASAEGQKPS